MLHFFDPTFGIYIEIYCIIIIIIITITIISIDINSIILVAFTTILKYHFYNIFWLVEEQLHTF